LELNDIWTVNPNRGVDILSDKLAVAFRKRIEQGSKGPLLRALIDTLKHDFVIGGICQLVGMMCMILSPYVVRHLITFSIEAYVAHMNGTPGPHIGPGLGYAFGLFAMQVLQSLTMNQALYRGMVVGGMAKAALTSQIFAKAMKLSNRAKAGGKQTDDAGQKPTEGDSSKAPAKDAGKDTLGWSNGRITTLLGVDVDRIDTASGMLHMIWVSPIGLIVALIILIVNIGYSALAGYALLVVGTIALAWGMRFLVRFRRAINKITDQRVTLTREILYSVRFVKFFGWESSFLKRLEAVRNREIGSIRRLLFVRHAIVVCMVSLPTFASLLSFLTYSLTDHGMSPDRIFSSLALFNVLRMPLIMLNLTITQTTDAWTALNRIQEFLQAEEKSDPVEWDTTMDKAIEVEHASFTWEQVQSNKEEEKKKEEKPKRNQLPPKVATPSGTPDNNSDVTEHVPFKLNDITFEAGRNELLAVIGTVGCGKSSLLAALAGDMRLTEGKIRMGATRSFCPQYAWIQNVTVRENILFGSGYDEELYDRVIDACALRADLEIFPNRDQTEIGERGITVSGGQKQRINIARAVYSKADIVLMDDPLSAVDAHVGRHIMDKAICGLLKDKCRILATHQLHVLSRCDRIIVMNNGSIDAIGTFDDLVRTNDHFRELLSTTSQQEKQSDDDDDEHSHDVEPAKDQIDKAKPAAALMSKEEVATGSVGWAVWKAYITASGSFFLNFIAFLLLLACLNAGLVMTGLWVSYWTSDKFRGLTTGQYLGIYAGICAAQALSLYGFALHVTIAAAHSSKTMLQRAMYRVLRAPMAFFDTTPLGRITNRFSRDVQVMDSELGESIRMFAFTFTQILATMGLIIAFYHYVSAIGRCVE
jgi:ABC-type multidrug transport system fused ATPase/permease subunit